MILKGDKYSLIKLLRESSKIVIVSHTNPDGDAIGSTMGLYHYLIKKGHYVTPIVPNEYPEFVNWLNEVSKIIICSKNLKNATDRIKEADIIFCVDFNEIRRIENIGQVLLESKAIKVLIDHHPNPPQLFDYMMHDTAASSSAELVYRFIIEMNDNDVVDKNIAECIYEGIVADTNCFSYNINGPATFHYAAKLIVYGIEHEKIYNLLYNNFSFNRMKLMGYCLNKKLIILPELKTGYIWLNKEEQKEYNFQVGDSEGFVNMPLSIKGIYISAFLKENDEGIRISCRSKGDFAVNIICKKHFNGGGHKNAAGGDIYLPINEAIQYFEKTIQSYKDEINKLYPDN